MAYLLHSTAYLAAAPHLCTSAIGAGVIAVETQTVMLNIPADPGAPDSSERAIPQAGQVIHTRFSRLCA